MAIRDTSDLATLINVARLRHEKNMTLEEIGKLVGGVTPTQINRLLEKARARGIIQIAVNAPSLEDTRERLKTRFNLHEVRIAPFTLNERDLPRLIGEEASIYLNEFILSNDSISIGLDGGRTTFHMVESLKPHPRKIKIYPLACLRRDPQISYVDSNVLVHQMLHKCGDVAEGYWVPLPPFDNKTSSTKVKEQRRKFLENDAIRAVYEGAKNVDIAVVGVGSFHRTAIDRASSTIQHLERIGLNFNELEARGAVGITMGTWFNNKARSVMDEYFLCVPLGHLKKLILRRKQVVLPAGGESKVKPIRVLLEHGMVNVLITDERTAVTLLA